MKPRDAKFGKGFMRIWCRTKSWSDRLLVNGYYLTPHQARMMAAWLLRAADWLEDREANVSTDD